MFVFFFFQAEDGIRDFCLSRGLGDVYKRQEEHRAKGCSSGTSAAGSECDHLEAEIARLAVVCPGHAPTLMANAVIAYDEHRPQDSQQYLDLILSQPRPYPDAAVLRAQIALEEGNVPFARRLVEQEIMPVSYTHLTLPTSDLV